MNAGTARHVVKYYPCCWNELILHPPPLLDTVSNRFWKVGLAFTEEMIGCFLGFDLKKCCPSASGLVVSGGGEVLWCTGYCKMAAGVVCCSRLARMKSPLLLHPLRRVLLLCFLSPLLLPLLPSRMASIHP